MGSLFADNVNCPVMRDEIARGMQLLGARKVSELRPEMIEVLDGLLGKQLKDSDA
jgi:L-lactate dehydrogenase (cytochrome)